MWGIYGREQYERNLEADLEYSKKFQKYYKEKYNIVISDEKIDARLPFCERVKVIENPYNIQINDYENYLNRLQNAENKCIQHSQIDHNVNWSIDEWFIYFTFGMGISETRIRLIQKLQGEDTNVVNRFLNEFEYDAYL